jgi:6-phosphofructokinase 1
MAKIALLTSGGDAPGMNAAIRAVVRTGLSSGATVIGVRHGFDGLQEGEFFQMSSQDVGAIITQGGTILRSARSETFMQTAGRETAARMLRKHKIDGLIVIGGDGSLQGGHSLNEETGVPVVGIPASIDNDVPETVCSIGFQTAVDTALNAIDKVRDTAYSHERVFVIEVMGRRNGFIAVEAGLAGGAEAILIPETPFDLSLVCQKLDEGRKSGKRSSIVIVAEGAIRAREVCKFISATTGYEARYLVLGHMQRGGSPCAFDRVLATRMGAFAMRRILNGQANEYTCLQCEEIVSVKFDPGLISPRPIDAEKLKLAELMST